MKKLILFLSALGLSFGCVHQALPPGGTTQETMITACRSYNFALINLMAFNLTPSELKTIDGIRAVANPICINQANYLTPNALSIVNDAVTELQKMGGKP